MPNTSTRRTDSATGDADTLLQQTFSIRGMRCQGCVNSIERALADMPGIRQVRVSLQPPAAHVESDAPLERTALNAALNNAGDYSIAEEIDLPDAAAPDESIGAEPDPGSVAGWQRYRPLLLVVAFLIGGCILLQVRAATWSTRSFMADFMGGFFLIFAFFKLLDLRGFATAYSSYDIIAARWFAYGYAYPFVEVALGSAYVLRWNPLATNLVTLVVMIIGGFGVALTLRRGRRIQCACLGTAFNLPMSTVTLVEDFGMALMAAGMLAGEPGFG